MRLEAVLTRDQFNKIKRCVSVHASRYRHIPGRYYRDFQDDVLSETLYRLAKYWDPEKGASPRTLAEQIAPQAAQRVYQQGGQSLGYYQNLPLAVGEWREDAYPMFQHPHDPEETDLFEEMASSLSEADEEIFRAYLRPDGSQVSEKEGAAALGTTPERANAKLSRVKKKLRKAYA